MAFAHDKKLWRYCFHHSRLRYLALTSYLRGGLNVPRLEDGGWCCALRGRWMLLCKAVFGEMTSKWFLVLCYPSEVLQDPYLSQTMVPI